VYSGKNDEKGVANLWTKDSLISIREFEKEVKALSSYKQTCLAKSKVGGSKDEIECSKKSFLSPLDILPDANRIESMTQFEL